MTKEQHEDPARGSEVHLPAELIAAMDELAEQWGTTRRNLVTEACQMYAALLRGGLRLTREGGSHASEPPRVTPETRKDVPATADQPPADRPSPDFPPPDDDRGAERVGKGVRG
jgi:hypothetical protein